MGDMESLQILNTAIIQSKNKDINVSYEDRLNELKKSPALNALGKSIAILSKEQGISNDQAAQQIVETIRSLDKIWTDFVVMEGLDRLKEQLTDNHLETF